MMLWFNSSQMEKALPLQETMNAIEKAYKIYGSGNFSMPLRSSLEINGNKLLLMPCGTERVWGVKILTLNSDNPAKGRPFINGLVELYDNETGAPLAVMDGRALTAHRTGAVGGSAIRRLASREASTLGIFGAGAQGFTQALFAAEARPVREIRVFDSCSDKLTEYVDRLSSRLPDVIVKACASNREVVENSEIIISATPSKEPVLPDDPGLLKDRFYVGVGSALPTQREFPDSFFTIADRIFIDCEHALEESGDLITPLENHYLDPDKITLMSDCIAREEGVQKGTILVKTVGMALFDLVVANDVYESALLKGAGQELEQ